jgi:succinate dehydrogenase / fumarate reductase, iron-sulfur subunit
VTEAAVHTWDGPTMDVALKIWRVDENGERELKTYEVEAPEWACLLDVLDIIKDQVDGTLAYRKSCRMMICGSCGMRMDGAAVLACRTRMAPIVEQRHVPVISAMGNLPIIRDLVVDMGPFWGKIRAVKPYLETGYAPVPDREHTVDQEDMEPIHKEALCIMCGCCVSECNSMEADPDFLGPAALAKAARFVYDVRDRGGKQRLEIYNRKNGVWDCTRCYFCNERCPKGVDPRDAIAKVGARIYQEGMLSDPGARHAHVFVKSTHQTGYLLETNLVPETIGAVNAIKEIPFALKMVRAGKVPNPLRPHKAKKLDEVRKLHKLLKTQEAAARDERRAGVSVDREEPAE